MDPSPSTSTQCLTIRSIHPYARSFHHPFANIRTTDIASWFTGAVLTGICAGLSISICGIMIKRRLEDDQWQPPWRRWQSPWRRWQPPWRQWLPNRGRRARRRWEEPTSLDGAVELGHMNGAANGAPTALGTSTAHGTTHATTNDTATGEASGTAAVTLDAITFTPSELTLNGAVSGPR